MENFFIDENFYSDIESYLSDRDMEEEEINALADDWEQKVELGELEKIFKAEDDIIGYVFDYLIDNNEERFSQEPDERTDNNIKVAIRESIDLEKLNLLLPELYYPSGKSATITKADLLHYI